MVHSVHRVVCIAMAKGLEILRTERDDVVLEWARAAQTSASARGLPRPALLNIMPRYVDALVDETDARAAALLERHLSARIREGFEIDEIAEALAILGRCIAGRMSRADPSTLGEAARVFACLGRGAVYSRIGVADHDATRRVVMVNEPRTVDHP
jgi:hypothetical protein